jgi:poly(hydroxyalkanoate) depolymerase family esterase
MTRRARSTVFSRSIQRTLKAMTRSTLRAGAKVVTQALRAPKPLTRKPAARKPALAKTRLTRPKVATKVPLRTGFTVGFAGAQRYRLFVPPGMQHTKRLPLLVMLHGCAQSADTFATSTRMNQIAAKEGFVVLYPEQNRLANLQGCWNWHQTRLGQTEAEAILATIHQVCQRQAIDPARIALAGLSAGASMATRMAVRYPEHFRAVAMHSGVAPGMAHSSASALTAMRGHGVATPLPALPAGTHLPALLVIQGSTDHLVAPGNGPVATQLWATREGAKAGPSRTVQRGARYPATLTDYKTKARLVATLCEIRGLGHAWSGGAANQAFSDPKGPDASRMIWAFAVKQFAKLVT